MNQMLIPQAVNCWIPIYRSFHKIQSGKLLITRWKTCDPHWILKQTLLDCEVLNNSSREGIYVTPCIIYTCTYLPQAVECEVPNHQGEDRPPHGVELEWRDHTSCDCRLGLLGLGLNRLWDLIKKIQKSISAKTCSFSGKTFFRIICHRQVFIYFL